jgi:hypothetical protein
LPLEEGLNGYIGPVCHKDSGQYGGYSEAVKDYDAYAACAIREGPGTEYAEMGATKAGQRYDVEGFEMSKDLHQWMRIKWLDLGEIYPKQAWYDQWQQLRQRRSAIWTIIGIVFAALFVIAALLSYIFRGPLREMLRPGAKRRGRHDATQDDGASQSGRQEQQSKARDKDTTKPPPSSKKGKQRAMEVLELDGKAMTRELIKRAYHMRVQLYHSDRFQSSGSDDLVRLAEEKMKELNWAKEFLLGEIDG